MMNAARRFRAPGRKPVPLPAACGRAPRVSGPPGPPPFAVNGPMVSGSGPCSTCGRTQAVLWLLPRLVGRASEELSAAGTAVLRSGPLVLVCADCVSACTYAPRGCAGGIVALLSSGEAVCAAHSDCFDPAPADAVASSDDSSVVACAACGFTGAADQRPGTEPNAACGTCNTVLCAACAEDPDVARETAARFGHAACSA